MSRILCAWELGGGAGHLHNLKIIGHALGVRGHAVSFALRDLKPVGRFFDPAETTLLQAPVCLHGSRLPTSRSYGELLNRVGYLETPFLSALLGAWRELLRMTKPDLVIAEHSPTALLAARLEGVRRVTLGTGFETPPQVTPMPDLQPWREIQEGRIEKGENAVLERINQALASMHGEPLHCLSDIFDVDRSFICSLPGFDHYSGRDGGDYYGPLSMSSSRDDVPWPPGEGERVFVYYRVGYPHFAVMMEQLAALGLPTLVVADDASPAVIKKFSTKSLQIVRRPVSLEAVAETAKLALCHAGHGSALQLVLAGCPLVMMPVVVEQALMGYRLHQAGVGVVVRVERGKKPDLAGSVRRVLDDPEFAASARALAAASPRPDPAVQIGRIADGCAAVMSAG